MGTCTLTLHRIVCEAVWEAKPTAIGRNASMVHSSASYAAIIAK